MSDFDFQAFQEAIMEMRHEVKMRDDVIAAYATVIETQAASIARLLLEGEITDTTDPFYDGGH